ncbi:MAG: H-NS histone family protein [Alphaproteobacteria bacterium]|nr:H-NS histone family protein [Alphaproteobacteria bacterium]
MINIKLFEVQKDLAMAPRRTHPVLKSLDELDAETLAAVIERASALHETKLEEARAALKAETVAKAKALGLDLSDLFGAERGKRGRKPGRAKATDVAFRSPQGETWSGRGRPPRWIVDLEAKGHKREKFRV